LHDFVCLGGPSDRVVAVRGRGIERMCVVLGGACGSRREIVMGSRMWTRIAPSQRWRPGFLEEKPAHPCADFFAGGILYYMA